jgi:hypothetical protein
MVVEKSKHSRKGTMKTTDEMRRARERFQLRFRTLYIFLTDGEFRL